MRITESPARLLETYEPTDTRASDFTAAMTPPRNPKRYSILKTDADENTQYFEMVECTPVDARFILTFPDQTEIPAIIVYEGPTSPSDRASDAHFTIKPRPRREKNGDITSYAPVEHIPNTPIADLYNIKETDLTSPEAANFLKQEAHRWCWTSSTLTPPLGKSVVRIHRNNERYAVTEDEFGNRAIHDLGQPATPLPYDSLSQSTASLAVQQTGVSRIERLYPASPRPRDIPLIADPEHATARGYSVGVIVPHERAKKTPVLRDFTDKQYDYPIHLNEHNRWLIGKSAIAIYPPNGNPPALYPIEAQHVPGFAKLMERDPEKLLGKQHDPDRTNERRVLGGIILPYADLDQVRTILAAMENDGHPLHSFNVTLAGAEGSFLVVATNDMAPSDLPEGSQIENRGRTTPEQLYEVSDGDLNRTLMSIEIAHERRFRSNLPATHNRTPDQDRGSRPNDEGRSVAGGRSRSSGYSEGRTRS